MTGQTYQTHVHRPTTWVVAWTGAVTALGLALWWLYAEPSLATATITLMAVVLVLGITLTRMFALRLQDRIIRLEMQVRLARLGLAAPADLTLKQMIALRFAADSELPALMQRAVSEKLTPDQIKRAVGSWQGDYLRT